MKTLVCIGDSLVEGEGDESGRGGWVGRMREKLPYDNGTDAAWAVYNLGIGGNTIRDVESRLGEVLVREPEVMILGCGTNDVMMYPEGDLLHPKLPQHVREASWRRVLAKMKAICPRVMVTPGTMFDHDYVITVQGVALGRGPHKEAFDRHVAFIERLCHEHDVIFVPLKAEFSDISLRDHDVHWNGRGYDLLAGLLHARLTELNWI